MNPFKTTKSSSSNALTSLTESSLTSSLAPSSTTSSSISASSSSSPSRPMSIARSSFDRRQPSSSSTLLAQSAPTLSWIPPPAPSSRPRVASIEPPPMTLPPSPPVWSPVHAEAARNDPTLDPTSSSSSAISIAQHNPSHLQPTQRYSRSLSNYSSSAPSHHDYLAAFRPLRQPEHKLDDDDDDPTPPTGINITQPPTRPTQPLELSKSPTILSMLTEHGVEGEVMYRRPSLIESHIAEGEEEEDEGRGDRERRAGEGGDDLQFSISLDGGDEEMQEGGDGELSDALY